MLVSCRRSWKLGVWVLYLSYCYERWYFERKKKPNRKIWFPVRHWPDVSSSQNWMLVRHHLCFVSFTLIFSDEFHVKSCGHCWHFPSRQIRRCHLPAGALVTFTWAAPSPRSPLAGPVSSFITARTVKNLSLRKIVEFQTVFFHSWGKTSHAENNSLSAIS